MEKLSDLFTKIGIVASDVVILIFLILKLCCLPSTLFEIYFLLFLLIYFTLFYFFYDKTKPYIGTLKLISYLFIITLIFIVFVQFMKFSVLVWLYPTILSAYFILRIRYAIIVSTMAILFIFLFFIKHYICFYDFMNLEIAIFVFSAFSYFVFRAVMKYEIKRILHERKLKTLSERDYLTGIYNRRKFFELAYKLNNKSALIMMDLDHFKQINDTYGHDTGDEVLKKFTELVKSHIRKEDIFARIGGEEFVLIIRNANEKTAFDIAEKIRKRIESADINGIRFTVSLGVTLYDVHENIFQALKRADKALYKAKKSRNTVVMEV
jgi:diguanylate cyclase (GGDEF)-like protein